VCNPFSGRSIAQCAQKCAIFAQKQATTDTIHAHDIIDNQCKPAQSTAQKKCRQLAGIFKLLVK
jgi:hypothetical protein